MIKTKALSSAAVLGMVAMLFAGCGDGDNTKTQVCRPSEATCLSDGNAARVCSADGTEFLTFECEDDEVCRAGACVGSCEVGEVTCAGKAVSRICSDEGNQWEPVPCPAGTACVEGDGCVPSDEGVTICEANESVCANPTTVKTCDADGAGWVYTACAPNESCDDGECVFDEDRTCTPRERSCVDGETAATCNDDGKGWTITECPEGISCSDGACRGPVCVVGETKCEEPTFLSILAANDLGNVGAVDFRTLYTCVDGVNWEATQCGAGTICAYDNVDPAEIARFTDGLTEWYLTFYGGLGGGNGASSFPEFPDTSGSVASCQKPECDMPGDNFLILAQTGYFGTDIFYGGLGAIKFAQCGDATDRKVDPTTAFSVCQGLPPYSNLEWSVTQCPAPTTCTASPTFPILGAFRCASECVPGEVRCALGSDFGDATQECQEDGTWGPPVDCGLIEYDGEPSYSAVCMPGSVLATGSSSARCMDPVCATRELATNPFYGGLFEDFGACTLDGRFRACDEDGFLEDPEPCEFGFCSGYGGPVAPAAGQSLGLCTAECVDGEARCFTGNTLQKCKDGEWSLELEVCDADVLCFDWYGSNGFGAICGECEPGTTYCDGDVVVTCDNKGVYVEDECSYGTCVDDGFFAHCEASCLEGQKVCGSDGSTSYAECVDGTFVAKNCGAGTSCRIDDKGVHYACVECLGPKTSGNEFSLVDAYCDADGDVVTCGNNNKYGSAKDCNATCTSYFDASDTPPLGPTWAYCGPAQMVLAVE